MDQYSSQYTPHTVTYLTKLSCASKSAALNVLSFVWLFDTFYSPCCDDLAAQWFEWLNFDSEEVFECTFLPAQVV